jgi:hypothetical protein
MRVGGNKNLKDFMAEQSFPAALSIPQRYSCAAMAAYRDRIKVPTCPTHSISH